MGLRLAQPPWRGPPHHRPPIPNPGQPPASVCTRTSHHNVKNHHKTVPYTPPRISAATSSTRNRSRIFSVQLSQGPAQPAFLGRRTEQGLAPAEYIMQTKAVGCRRCGSQAMQWWRWRDAIGAVPASIASRHRHHAGMASCIAYLHTITPGSSPPHSTTPGCGPLSALFPWFWQPGKRRKSFLYLTLPVLKN